MKIENNRLWNCKNPNQGSAKKVLCVCSAGLLRSPTMANVLHQKYGYNTRSCGLESYALIQIDDILIAWADEIVCAESWMVDDIKTDKPIFSLNIPDQYPYGDKKLIEFIERGYDLIKSNEEIEKVFKENGKIPFLFHK